MEFKEDIACKGLDVNPCSIIIFGVTGDLARKKLFPALNLLQCEGLLPANFTCLGFARRDKDDDVFRNEINNDIKANFNGKRPFDEKCFDKCLKSKIFYHKSSFDDDSGYISLKKKLDEFDIKYKTQGNRIFYLATPPKYFPIIIEKLSKAKLIYDTKKEKKKFSRVVIEKPYGRDLQTSKDLHNIVSKHLEESQIYRIDHYLGKETVQNLLVFRFANSIFESIWNYKHIDHVQITFAEEDGIGTRGHFFEEQGLLRDVIQNHVMQLLSLIAMEPPVNISASAIRDEKVKVLQSIRTIIPQDIEKNLIRGQYDEGTVDGKKVNSYRDEKDVDKQSNVETFVALKLCIDNWRWESVPFYIRAGKRLKKRATEISIVFKEVPGFLFKYPINKNDVNVLTIRIQPDEGIKIKFNCKEPGQFSKIKAVDMDFLYSKHFNKETPDAYERLIFDCIMGDNTLFARCDEVENSWRILSPILKFWERKKADDFPNYSSGSWGPKKADEMIENDGRHWQNL
jgi:glucose-6-phosphate 1-dehydrogenase